MESDDVASLDSAEALCGRRDYFAERALKSTEQVIHRAAVKYRSSAYTMYDIADVHARVSALRIDGIWAIWSSAGLPHQALLKHWLASRPTEADGSWFGEPDLLSQITPPLGQPVVYVLYGADCEPLYVGSTSRFRHRIKDHRKSKEFAFWKAWTCASREEAYVREVEMLKGSLPPLNQRVGR